MDTQLVKTLQLFGGKPSHHITTPTHHHRSTTTNRTITHHWGTEVLQQSLTGAQCVP